VVWLAWPAPPLIILLVFLIILIILLVLLDIAFLILLLLLLLLPLLLLLILLLLHDEVGNLGDSHCFGFRDQVVKLSRAKMNTEYIIYISTCCGIPHRTGITSSSIHVV
jgi:hypothetical protein